MTKLVASFAFTALILLLGAIVVHLGGGFTKNLDTVLALAGGFMGLLGGLIGFVSNMDNPWAKN